MLEPSRYTLTGVRKDVWNWNLGTMLVGMSTVQLLWPTVGQFLKMLKLPYDHMSQQILLLRYVYSRELRHGHTESCTWVFKAAFITSQSKRWKQSKCLPIEEGHRKCDICIQWNTIQARKKLSADTGHNMNESWKQYTKWRSQTW